MKSQTNSFGPKNSICSFQQVLLQSGAAINDRNTKLLTPLDCAASYGQVSAAKVLLDANASVEPMHKHGMTPLLYASRHGHGKMVELLLQSCNISMTDESGRNCLDLAIDHGKRLVQNSFVSCIKYRENDI